MEPNIENITKWVEALESDEYVQCTGRLRGEVAVTDPDPTTGEVQIAVGHCCLGVATDLYLNEVGGEWVPDTSLLDHCDAVHVAEDDGGLPLPVQEWLGIGGVDPILRVEKGPDCATHLNDAEMLDFHEIAAAIRRTYLEEDA